MLPDWKENQNGGGKSPETHVDQPMHMAVNEEEQLDHDLQQNNKEENLKVKVITESFFPNLN